jgi:hypothetical protein
MRLTPEELLRSCSLHDTTTGGLEGRPSKMPRSAPLGSISRVCRCCVVLCCSALASFALKLPCGVNALSPMPTAVCEVVLPVRFATDIEVQMLS